MFEGLFQAFWLMFKSHDMIGVILGTSSGLSSERFQESGQDRYDSLAPGALLVPPEVGLPILTALWAADGYGGKASLHPSWISPEDREQRSHP